MKIPQMGAELLHGDRRTDRHDKADRRFSQFCESAKKFCVLPTQRVCVFCVDLRTNSDYFPIQH